ncbi:MAG: hypothetical protein ACR2LR_13030 [Hassallia sp.]
MTLDLNNSALWNLVWSANVQAELVPDKPRYLPIPPVEIPFLLDSHIIAVLLSSSTAPPSWKFGAFLNQKIATGIIVGGLTETDTHQEKIWLNRISLVILPRLSSTYSLNFNIPHWFYDMSLKLWVYSGEENISTLNDSLEEVKDSLSSIEKVLDKIRREL